MSAHLRLLIAALGGEGGGVLASWITDAAVAQGLAAQRTSIPGVAQRTGATTYYIELIAGAEGRRPVMALNPTPGEVDLVVASELMEAARVVQGGFVTPQRTCVLASTHRVYTIQERIALGDGRADADAMRTLVERFAKQPIILDFGAIAAQAGSHVNSVLLGAMSPQLPLTADALRAAIRRDGRAVEANLRGFEAGLAAVTARNALPATTVIGPRALRDGAPVGFEAMVAALPESARAIASEGLHRLIDFQDAAHARLYGERLARFAAQPGANGALVAEFARHLAVRMSSEDTIRVAQLKLRDDRLARLAAEAKARPGDLVEVTEFLKPGPEEILSILPAGIARALLGVVHRYGWSQVAIPLKVRTSGIVGFLALKLLASLRPLRPRSLRAAQEHAWIEEWLELVTRTTALDPEAAAQVIETATLVRGYGETWTRGQANWRRIADEIIVPMLDGKLPRAHFADAVTQARLAAQADPEGNRLGVVVGSLKELTA
jgi:indolepyruvate ferredoxin oxidoreductase beta subunit